MRSTLRLAGSPGGPLSFRACEPKFDPGCCLVNSETWRQWGQVFGVIVWKESGVNYCAVDVGLQHCHGIQKVPAPLDPVEERRRDGRLLPALDLLGLHGLLGQAAALRRCRRPGVPVTPCVLRQNCRRKGKDDRDGFGSHVLCSGGIHSTPAMANRSRSSRTGTGMPDFVIMPSMLW